MAIGPALAAALVLLTVAWLRVRHILRCIHAARTHRRSAALRGDGPGPARRPLRTLVVLGSGGHTTEVLALVAALDPSRYAPIHYCKAASDSTSLQRLQRFQRQRQRRPGSDAPSCDDGADTVHDIPRAREVGQGYASSVLTTLRAQAAALRLVRRLRPDLIVCNGPGTCLPVCAAALLLRLLGRGPRPPTTLVFCESLCRVESLSLTGRLLYPLADVFLVHWGALHRRYPLAQKVNAFVADDA